MSYRRPSTSESSEIHAPVDLDTDRHFLALRCMWIWIHTRLASLTFFFKFMDEAIYKIQETSNYDINFTLGLRFSQQCGHSDVFWDIRLCLFERVY